MSKLALKDMRPVQQRCITALYESDNLLLVLRMGGGKTAVALTAIKELLADGIIRQAIVLAPKKVALLTWPDEIARWEHLEGLGYVVCAGTPAQRQKALLDPTRAVKIIGIDNAQWLCDELAKLPDHHPLMDLMLIDETSRLKNPRSKRGQALRKQTKRFRALWGMTGTPRPNDWRDLFTPMAILTKETIWGKSYDKWLRENFMSDYMGQTWTVHPWREPWLKECVDRWTVTVPDSDLPYLPEPTDRVIEVPLPDEIIDQYLTMQEHLVAQMEAGTVVAANAAVKTSKMEQLTQGMVYTHDIIDPDRGEPYKRGTYELAHTAKLDMLEELLTDPGSPILVPYYFQSELAELRLRFPDLPYIGAGVDDAQTLRWTRAWNAGDLPRMLIHPASGGHGLNLQFGGATLLWTAPIWSAEYWDQTIRRIARPGQQNEVINLVLSARMPDRRMINVDAMKLDRVMGKMEAQAIFTKHLRKV